MLNWRLYYSVNILSHSTCSYCKIAFWYNTSICVTWALGWRKWENIAAETFWVNVAHSIAWVSKWRGRKTFFFLRRKFYVFKICYVGTQTRTQAGNIRSQCFFSVFQMLPCLRPHLITQNLPYESKKCFWNFPKTFFASWTQFCFRDNVFSFPLARRCHKKKFSSWKISLKPVLIQHVV